MAYYNILWQDVISYNVNKNVRMNINKNMNIWYDCKHKYRDKNRIEIWMKIKNIEWNK